MRKTKTLVASLAFLYLSAVQAQSQPAPARRMPAQNTPAATPSPTPLPKITPPPQRPGGKNKPPRITPKKYTQGRFLLQWTYKDFPLRMRAMTAPFRFKMRVGETKVVDNLVSLEVGKELLDGVIDVTNGRSTVLYLVMQNTTPNAVSFVVSPHQIHPVHTTLGFQFKCLCYGHTYTVPPGKYWYRIVELSPFENNATEPIRLVHDVVGVPTPKAK